MYTVPSSSSSSSTGVRAEKFTGSSTTSLSKKYFTDKTCTTDSTDTDTKFPLSLTDANTCHVIDDGEYVKYVSTSTAAEAQAQAAASGSGTGTASGSVSIRASLTAMLMLVKALL